MTKLGSRKLRFSPKVTNTGSKIGHRINYNGVGALRGQRHISSKNQPESPRGVKVFNSFEVHLKYVVAFPISVKTSSSSNNILNLERTLETRLFLVTPQRDKDNPPVLLP